MIESMFVMFVFFIIFNFVNLPKYLKKLFNTFNNTKSKYNIEESPIRRVSSLNDMLSTEASFRASIDTATSIRESTITATSVDYSHSLLTASSIREDSNLIAFHDPTILRWNPGPASTKQIKGILETTKNLENKDDNNGENTSRASHKRKIVILDELENKND